MEKIEEKYDAAGLIPLSKLRSGQHGIIVSLLSKNNQTMHKLMALGVLPGMRVTVQQTYPGILFRIGHTQVAIDAELAQEIIIYIPVDKSTHDAKHHVLHTVVNKK
ncbi:MAG: FeoA family protein [bacterium]